MSKLKQFGKESLVYGVSGVVNKFLAFFLVPIMTRIFLPYKYGVIDLILTTTSIISVFVILGLDSSLGFYYFNSKGEEQKKYVDTTFCFELFIGVVVAIVFTIFSQEIAFRLFKNINYYFLIIIAIWEIPFVSIESFFVSLSRFKFKPWTYNFMVIFHVILQYLGVIILVIVLKMDLKGFFIAKLISDVLITIICLFVFRKDINIKMDMMKLKELLRYGIPLVPISIMYWIMSGADRYFLKYYSDLSSIGLYSVGLKISTIMSLFVNAFQMAWGPFSFSIKDDKEANSTYAKVLSAYSIISFILVLGIMSIAKPVLFYVTTPKYMQAFCVIGILAVSIVINGAYYIFSTGVSLVKKTYYITYASILGVIVNIVLNFVLVSRFNIFGAAMGTMVGYLVSTISVYYFSQKFYYIRFDLKYLAKTTFLFIIFFSLIQALDIKNIWIDTLYKLILTSVFVTLCIIFKLIPNWIVNFIKEKIFK